MSETNDIIVEVNVDNEEHSESMTSESPEESENCDDSEDETTEQTIESLMAEIEAIKEQHKLEIEAVAESERIQYEDERERLLRTVAEAENSKKRLEGESQKQLKFANENIIKGIIPVLDSLEAAIKSITEWGEEAENSSEISTYSDGVELVYKQFIDVLNSNGLIKINAEGLPFDPNQHESVFATESDEVPKGNIIEELRSGYKLHDRVLRASQIIVSKGQNETAPPSAETEEEDTNPDK